jgi:hypothetical protein
MPPSSPRSPRTKRHRVVKSRAQYLRRAAIDCRRDSLPGCRQFGILVIKPPPPPPSQARHVRHVPGSQMQQPLLLPFNFNTHIKPWIPFSAPCRNPWCNCHPVLPPCSPWVAVYGESTRKVFAWVCSGPIKFSANLSRPRSEGRSREEAQAKPGGNGIVREVRAQI